MVEYVLREFVCVECRHTVVVNPNLPPDYEPKMCMDCYERIEAPRQRQFMMKLFAGLQDISDKLKRM